MRPQILLLLCVSGLMLATPGARAQNPDWPGALGNCLRIVGAVERLACYDRLARGVVDRPAVAAAPPPPQTIPARPPASVDFGVENLPRSAPAAVARADTMTAEIADFKLSPGAPFIVMLSNGQTWRQSDEDHTLARFHPGQTRAVTISRGAFGSYNLIFNDRSVVYKVVRVN